MTRASDDRDLPTTPSPCVRNCCLDEDDVCLGCGRSLGEILHWRDATSAEQEVILTKAHDRRMQRRRAQRKIL